MIKCDQLRATQQNIVSLIHICLVFFFSQFLYVVSEKGAKREIGRLAIKKFLRNGWNWEINRLISRRQEAFRTLFLFAFRWHKLFHSIAISSRLSMSDDTVEETQQVSSWLHTNLTASTTPINLFSSVHPNISTLKSSWNMSSLKCLRLPEFNPKFNRLEKKPRGWNDFISCKNAAKNAQTNNFFFIRFFCFSVAPKMNSLLISSLPFSSFCFNLIVKILTRFQCLEISFEGWQSKWLLKAIKFVWFSMFESW